LMAMTYLSAADSPSSHLRNGEKNPKWGARATGGGLAWGRGYELGVEVGVPVVQCPAGSRFPGVRGRTDESSPAWPAPVPARTGAPNVVLDDAGSGQLGCAGDRRAAGTVRRGRPHRTHRTRTLPRNHHGGGRGPRRGLQIPDDGAVGRWRARPAVDPDGRRPVSSWTGTNTSRPTPGGQR
jgi:hypothetical protein